MLLAEHEPSKIRRRLADFYDAAIDARLPEATRLAATIQTWWPAILVALAQDVSNARTEGFNRIIKQTKRVSVNRPSLWGIAGVCKVPRMSAGRVDDDGDRVFGEERRWCFGWWLRPTGIGWSGQGPTSIWSTGSWTTWAAATSRRRLVGPMPSTC
jgi:hypothetical protein